MEILRVNSIKRAAKYDFAVDGGAQGVYNTNIYVPAGCKLTLSVFIETLFASATDAADVSVGTTNTDNFVINGAAPSTLTQGSTTIAGQYIPAADESVIITVATEDLTAGVMTIIATIEETQ